jgi:enoyl-ACP reductase-like protein
MRGVPVERMRQSFVDRSPLRRTSRPEDVAALAVFLCSDLARNVSGQCIPVTAGEPASSELFEGERIDRRPHRSGDRQRRRDEEELVHAVAGTVVCEIVEEEDLADRQPHVGDAHLVQRLE